jgi:hypothetical protein
MERGVFLQNPVERASIAFLWPLRIEVESPYVLVRFVVLEKNIASYFDRPSYPAERGISENDILEGVTTGLGLQRADITRGVKRLWHTDFMDGHHVRYKTPRSVASETMNEERGIKANHPELYATLRISPLTQMIFKIGAGRNVTVDTFSTDPSQGTLAFHKYSDNAGDTDRVIREILQRN